MPVGSEPSLRGGSPGGDIELEHIAITALTDMGGLLGYRCGQRDGGTPKIADGAVRLARPQLDDEDLPVRPGSFQVQQRAGFAARCFEVWQEMRFRLLRDPTRIRHQMGELGKVSGECLSRGHATTAFVVVPAFPDFHPPIVA